ncbi:hypothetical protein LCGC14_1301790 [marine sediment metagenome]|uniref:Uncharacterized protein n=1 Tax=marine sediment metagenome TaxID=412755 RepID=A0A0F9KPQ7_9ZZZZ
MTCCIRGCRETAKHFYKIKEVKFDYCGKHKYIPDKIIYHLKNGFYMPWVSRDRNAMPT